MILPHVDCRIDWFSATKRGFWAGLPNASSVSNQYEAQQVARDVFGFLGMSHVTMSKVQHQKGYHYAYEEFQTGTKVHVASSLSDQGVMVVLSGDTLKRIDSVPVRVQALLCRGYRCSRMDVAFDVYNSGVSIDALAEAYFEAHPAPRLRKAGFISSGGGSTLYIGSRYSSKMLRCYDKGREQQTSLDWIRLEMEYKREFIHAAAHEFVEKPSRARHDVADMLDMPRSLIVGILEQFGEDVDPVGVVVGRKKTDTQLWFETIVASAFSNLMEQDLPAARDVVQRLTDMLGSGVASDDMLFNTEKFDGITDIL